MTNIKTTIAALGLFMALPVVQGFAMDRLVEGRASRIDNTAGVGVYQPKGTTKPPVLTQVIPFSCDKGTCWCKNNTDCGEMGRLGVCKTGTFKENKTGGGSCTMKPV